MLTESNIKNVVLPAIDKVTDTVITMSIVVQIDTDDDQMENFI